jgi:hypothetical protein
MGLGVDSAPNPTDCEYQESSWGKGWPACKADNLQKVGTSASNKPMDFHGLSQG